MSSSHLRPSFIATNVCQFLRDLTQRHKVTYNTMLAYTMLQPGKQDTAVTTANALNNSPMFYSLGVGLCRERFVPMQRS